RSAATGPRGLRALRKQLAGGKALDGVLGDRGHQVDLAVDDAADADDARAEAVAQRVGHRTQPVRVESVDPARHDGDTVDLPRARYQVGGATAREPGLHL